MINIRNLKKMLMEGDLKEAIGLLDDFLYKYDKSTHNYLIILSSKFSQVSKGKNIGTVDYKSFSMVVSQIQLAILEDIIPKVEVISKLENDENLMEELEELENKRKEIEKIEKKLSLRDESSVLISEESLKTYLDKEFKDLPFESYDDHFEDVFLMIDTKKYKYLRDLDLIFSLTEKARRNYVRNEDEYLKSQLTQLDLAIACIDSEYRHRISNWSSSAREVFNSFHTNNEYCSFCGGNKKDKLVLVAGISAYICDTCSVEAVEIVEDELKMGS